MKVHKIGDAFDPGCEPSSNFNDLWLEFHIGPKQQ